MRALCKRHYKFVKALYLQSQHRASFRRRNIYSKIISLKQVKLLHSQHIFISTQISLIKNFSRHLRSAVLHWNNLKNTKVWKYVCNRKLAVLDLDATKPAMKWLQLAKRNLERLNIRFSSCTSFFAKSEKLFHILRNFKALKACDFTPNNMALFSLNKPLAKFLANNKGINFKIALNNVEPQAIWNMTEAVSKHDYEPDNFCLSLNTQTTVKDILKDLGNEPEYFVKELIISTRVGINLKDCSLFSNMRNFLCLKILKMTIGFDFIYQDSNFEGFLANLGLPQALKKFSLVLTDSWAKPSSIGSRPKENYSLDLLKAQVELESIEDNPIFQDLVKDLEGLTELEELDISFLSPQNNDNYHLFIYVCSKMIPNLKSLNYSIGESCLKSFNLYLCLSLLKNPSSLEKFSVNCYQFSGANIDLQSLSNLSEIKLTSKVHNPELSLAKMFSSLAISNLLKLIVNDGINLECLDVLYNERMELRLRELFLDISKTEISDLDFLKFLHISISNSSLENFQICAAKCKAHPDLICFIKDHIMAKRNLKVIYVVLQNHIMEKCN